jgi:hypothetical protein
VKKNLENKVGDLVQLRDFWEAFYIFFLGLLTLTNLGSVDKKSHFGKKDEMKVFFIFDY